MRNIFSGIYQEGNMVKTIEFIGFNKTKSITTNIDFPFPVKTGKGKISNKLGNAQLKLE
jgi:hypothetical protein